ncbi:guanine nucleotide binding protein, alpha subunit [Entophlyctis helioformis]|nr:guanine nucleotide binding protein, alpha subunit [Entophlyctis helioformis]
MSLADCVVPSADADDESRLARMTSDVIDHLIRADAEQRRLADKEPRLLILGSGDSGKTTLLKQLRLLHGKPFSGAEAQTYHELMVHNAALGLTGYLQLCDLLSLHVAHSDERALFEMNAPALMHRTTEIPANVVAAMQALWCDPAVQSVLPIAPQHNIQDTAPYFLAKIDAIAAPGYTPTNDDILQVRSPTTGVSETVFNINNRQLHFIDVGGQRGLRKQWSGFFDNCHAILFVASISSFDQTLHEIAKDGLMGSLMGPDADLDSDLLNPDAVLPTNRLADAVQLFGQIVNNRVLAKSQVVLFLNKDDLFRDKLARGIRFADFVHGYDGPNKADAIAKHVRHMFMAQRRDKDRIVTVHRTCCTDTNAMQILVGSLIESLTRSALESVGIL